MTEAQVQREIDVRLMASILEARQAQGDKFITRRGMFDYVERISPRKTIHGQKLGVDFSGMLEEAANRVGAKFVTDTHPSGKRKNVRVVF